MGQSGVGHPLNAKRTYLRRTVAEVIAQQPQPLLAVMATLLPRIVALFPSTCFAGRQLLPAARSVPTLTIEIRTMSPMVG